MTASSQYCEILADVRKTLILVAMIGSRRLVAGIQRAGLTNALASQSRNVNRGHNYSWGGPGVPQMYLMTTDKPWNPYTAGSQDETIPRDGFGVPGQIPPEIATSIKHTYAFPPHFFPFLKKLGEDTPSLKKYTDKAINGTLSFVEFEEMFYKFAKPLRVHRSLITMPYRTQEEMAKSDEVLWEGKWLSFRQRVQCDWQTQMYTRQYVAGAFFGLYIAYLWAKRERQYRVDMKLFYLEAPECKYNWIVPRGDL